MAHSSPAYRWVGTSNRWAFTGEDLRTDCQRGVIAAYFSTGSPNFSNKLSLFLTGVVGAYTATVTTTNSQGSATAMTCVTIIRVAELPKLYLPVIQR